MFTFPLECEVERKCAKHEQQPEGDRSRAIDGDELRVLTGTQYELVCLPEQSVVRPQPVRPCFHLAGIRLAELQHGQLLAIERDEDLAIASVLWRLSRNRDS